MKTTKVKLEENGVYDVDVVFRFLGIGRNVGYDLINTGRLKSFKANRCRRITGKAAFEFIEQAEKEESDRLAESTLGSSS